MPNIDERFAAAREDRKATPVPVYLTAASPRRGGAPGLCEALVCALVLADIGIFYMIFTTWSEIASQTTRYSRPGEMGQLIGGGMLTMMWLQALIAVNLVLGIPALLCRPR